MLYSIAIVNYDYRRKIKNRKKKKKKKEIQTTSPSEKCSYSELFWSLFSRIWTEYGELPRISPYSDQMQENTDQNNSEYRQFLRSAYFGHESSSIFIECCYFHGNDGKLKTNNVTVTLAATDRNILCS